jgi:4-hydroxythreonine-4-phosphate dehydrogenase
VNRPIIGITMGDPAGVGPEIIVKALSRPEVYKLCRPVVVGSGAVLSAALRITSSPLELNVVSELESVKGEHGWIDVLDLRNIELGDFVFGRVNAEAGRASVEYIFRAIDLALAGELDAVVTGPINKEAMNAAGFHYAGHTEIFAQRTGAKEYAMLLVDGEMRVVHVSTHVSLREACELVKKERVLTVIRLAAEAMKALDISRPKIAVAGLNPHAGENGLFGREEIEEIIPAVETARSQGFRVEGPLPPDTVFPKLRGGQYDIVVAMYHDQGHIPMKLAGFRYDQTAKRWSSISGVNVTLGLPIIRTSVDHGTAYNHAGKGTANEDSMVDAIKMAVSLSRKGEGYASGSEDHERQGH